jgi:two-component system, response regulator PdtaR
MTKGDACPRDEENSRPVILVVEDEVLVRMATAEQLRQAGYSVVEAANAHEALQVLHHTPGIDLILTDIRMPGPMDGLELARSARLEYPEIKIMLVSGDLPAVDLVAHEGYFCKPYDVQEIIGHIKKFLY